MLQLDDEGGSSPGTGLNSIGVLTREADVTFAAHLRTTACAVSSSPPSPSPFSRCCFTDYNAKIRVRPIVSIGY